MIKAIVIYLLSVNLTYAQEAEKEVYFFTNYLGKTGVLVLIGLIFFIYSYSNSVKLFAWIENQTYGKRDYVLQKCELLFYEIKPDHVTYILLFLTFGVAILTTSTFFLFGKYTLGALMGAFFGFIGWKIPKPVMNYLVDRRITIYETQMVDGLNLLSNGMRAGLSVQQAIGMVVEELPNPISQEFNLLLQQTKIGVPLNEAFDNLAKRVPTQDNDMFVSSVNILRETGGNLAEVFDTIAEVIRERVRLKQKIATYVAQGKMQGGMIASMPLAMGAYFASSDPDFVPLLFGTIVGNIVLFVAVTLNVVGAYAMWRVIQIKV